MCQPGYALDLNDNCIPCAVDKGLRIDETNHCVCALERGMNLDERGRCVCAVEHGYRLTKDGYCEPENPRTPGCASDDECPDNRYCNVDTRQCEDPCKYDSCGINALCNATQHKAVCKCITGYTGNPEIQCSKFELMPNIVYIS